MAPKKRKISQDRVLIIQEQVQNLLDAGFICEVIYHLCLSNFIIVKKSYGKWQMCIDYTDLNKAYPKNSYSLPSIDELVDAASSLILEKEGGIVAELSVKFDFPVSNNQHIYLLYFLRKTSILHHRR